MKKYFIIFGLYSISLFGAASNSNSYAAVPAEERQKMLTSISIIRQLCAGWEKKKMAEVEDFRIGPDQRMHQQRIEREDLRYHLKNIGTIHGRYSIPLPQEPDIDRMLFNLEYELRAFEPQ